jgi:hypothetical protein
MPEKISVYVDKELHRALKAEASLRGKSLSELMVDAALRTLYAPHRQAAAAQMDLLRGSVKDKLTAEEIQSMRREGRL